MKRFLSVARMVLVASVSVSALAFVTFSVGTAVAAFPDDNVKLYTGCLAPGGNIYNVKEGDSPLQPCSPASQIVKLSGGDITKITVTGALSGGGGNGAVTIGLDGSKTVPMNCSSGQVPKWNGSAWGCGNDNDTKYNAGTGLNLTSGSFSIAQAYRLPDFTIAGSGCNDGDTVVIKNGQWSCAASNGIEMWSADGYGDAPHGLASIPGASLTLPPGKYLVLFSGMAVDAEELGGISGTGNGDVTTWCVLFDNAGHEWGGPDIAFNVDASDTPISGNVIVTSTQTTPTFYLKCSGDQDYVRVTMRAIKIGVAH